MELQPRDISILEQVGELGTADTDILRSLHFPDDSTGRACQQRLKKLADEGLLTRVRLIATDGHLQQGRVPTLYFLTEQGAELVLRETGVMPRRVTRSDPKPFTLRHRMETVRARLAIDQAARFSNLPPPVWIMEQDTRPTVSQARSRSPSDQLLLSTRYEHHGKTVSFYPDAACHLRVPHRGSDASLLAYFEIDRSTEGHQQWQRKLLGIEAFLSDPAGWKDHWPAVTAANVIVLVLCKSDLRSRNLAETTRPSAAAPRIRFSVYPVDPRTILRMPVWLDCQGRSLSILRSCGGSRP